MNKTKTPVWYETDHSTLKVMQMGLSIMKGMSGPGKPTQEEIDRLTQLIKKTEAKLQNK